MCAGRWRPRPTAGRRDAVDAALVALHRNGHLKAERDGRSLATAQLDQSAIGRTRFRPERVAPDAIAAPRAPGTLRKTGACERRSGEEEDGARKFLASFECELAVGAGGDPPLPAVPATGFLKDLSRLAGNEQLAAILKARAEIEAAIKEWKRLAERADERRRAWDLANCAASPCGRRAEGRRACRGRARRHQGTAHALGRRPTM